MPAGWGQINRLSGEWACWCNVNPAANGKIDSVSPPTSGWCVIQERSGQSACTRWRLPIWVYDPLGNGRTTATGRHTNRSTNASDVINNVLCGAPSHIAIFGED